jgi:hypothetical protein
MQERKEEEDGSWQTEVQTAGRMHQKREGRPMEGYVMKSIEPASS